MRTFLIFYLQAQKPAIPDPSRIIPRFRTWSGNKILAFPDEIWH